MGANKRVLVFYLCLFFTTVLCQDIHLIETKPNQCFVTYMENEPIFLSKVSKACTKYLQNHGNCLGLETKNGETVILECKDKISKLERGCYKIVNRDRSEGVVCQKLVRRRGCEIISTPTMLNIEVFCYPVQAGNAGIIVVKDNKPRRE